MTNVVVTSTVNEVTFKVDNASYNKAIKKIKSVKREWEKGASGLNKSKTSPAKVFDKSAAQMKMVNKRLEQTRRNEAKKSTDHAIAQAKRQARAEDVLRKQSAARIRQHVGSLTAANPESSRMRKFYRQMERDAKRTSREPVWNRVPESQRNLELKARQAAAGGTRPGFGTGMATNNPPKPFDQAYADRQTAAMFNRGNVISGGAEKHKVDQKAINARAKAEAQAAQRASRRQDTIGQQDVRLRGKYGAGYSAKIGGKGAIDQLNKEFANGAISVGMYRAQIASLERQFRSAQNGAMSFGDGMKSLRSTMVGVTATYGAFQSGKSVLESGQFFQGLDATMSMVSDSTEEAGSKIKFLKDQSYRLGLDLKTASQGYTQMSVAAEGVISDQQNNDLFKGFSEYATALQVDKVKFQRGITAIGQMMGKGVIMSEELKSQLAEGIPGSMQVFVKAAQKYFKDDKIGIPELNKLMKDGKLFAKEILPFVAEEYAEAARKGDALNKALLGSRVAMARLGHTWMLWQNKIFESQFGQKMTDTFNRLAQILDNNGPLAETIGRFFGNMMEGAMDMITFITDAFLFLSRLLDHYAAEFGVKGETFGKIFDWAAWGLGAGLFLTTVSRIFGVLSKIVGLRGALSTVLKMGGAAAAGGTGAAEASSLGLLAGGSYLGPALLGGYAINNMNNATEDADGLNLWSSMMARFKAGGWANYQQQKMNPSDVPQGNVGSGIGDWWSGERAASNQKKLNYLVQSGQAPLGTMVDPPFLPTAPPDKGTIEIKVDAGELNKILRVAIDESEMERINLIMAGGVM